MGKDFEPLHQVLHEEGSPESRNCQETLFTSSCRVKVYASFLLPSSTDNPRSDWSVANNRKPLTAYLFYSGTETSLGKESDLIMDIPGGGFICMNPEHHAERLLRWAKQTGRPVISFDYGKVSLPKAHASILFTSR